MGALGVCLWLGVWICPLLLWAGAGAFNLDTQNVLRKNGDSGSLFGFSIALHRQLQPADKRILLIGAPRAKALANQGANITGGLYSCDITTQRDDCDRIEFDNDADVRVENKENQWMGVTVQSQGPGGKIVTCAHRYQRRLFVNTPQESRDITGRCYVLSQDLSIDSQSDEDGGNWKFCEGRARGHERFGACQQGVAATFTKDYHYVIFGAPGAYNWKGNGDSAKYFGFLSQGFSLDSGHSITEKGKLIVVSGAPRANHSGAVILLKKAGEVSTMLSPEHILEGPGLASSFGYDVAVVDLNGDGWQDIVVGAPQFFQRDGEVGGAVYVYINKAGKWSSVVPVRLNGTKDSMFGLAVENIGDINLDSYEDIAVGAPYADEGSGRVYIYHGSVDGINTKPVQILEGRHHGIKMFGYSLAGNMDLDENSYPDLAVGSLSDAVITESHRRKQGLPSRVSFLDKKPTDQDFQSTGTLELRGQNKRACYKAKLRLQVPAVNFLKEGCGTDNICQSNLQLQYRFCYRASNQDIFPPLPVTNGVAVVSLSDQKDIALEVTVKNRNGDDAHEAKLVGQFGDLLSYSGFRSHRTTVSRKQSNQNGSQADCELGNPFKRDSEVTFYIILSTAKISLSTTEVEVDLQLETTSLQEGLGKVRAKAKVMIELLLSVQGVAKPSQVYFGGDVRGESAMKSEEEAGSLIEYEFRVINLGKPLKSVGTAFLNIQWPKESAVGKWLLYLVKISSKELEEITCSPETEINPLGLTEGSMVSRQKREIGKSRLSEENKMSVFTERRKYKSLSCFGDAKCVEIKCPLLNLDSSADIILRSRLWNSTFLEVRLTVFPEYTVSHYGGVPWWIILVAVLAGILMLALLVLILWKVSLKD
uniref:Integrin alpha-2 domain-containing protein n=1 Tax=Pygocentrus nattereri TaxID=42514 RepID=A0AAR2JLC5_PYGNA